MALAPARTRHSPEETRASIIAVAEEHFRRIGYAKTAVADIAATLGMSPANVYRFFPSKLAINEAICGRLMSELHSMIAEVMARALPAGERLEMLIVAIHSHNKDRLTADKRIHDMVEVAMAEDWESINDHCNHIRHVFAQLVADGIAKGEFAPVDPQATAATLFSACAAFFHPTLIAQCSLAADRDQAADVRALAAFLRRALAR